MGHGTRQATCRLTAFDELDCTIPYHRELIERWKTDIPFRCREYIPTSKTWRFTGEYLDIAIARLLQVFPDAEIPARWRAHSDWGDVRRESPSSHSHHFSALHLLPSAPRAVIDAAYRALAKLHHPDLGGDPAVMRQLTEAYDVLSRRLSA